MVYCYDPSKEIVIDNYFSIVFHILGNILISYQINKPINNATTEAINAKAPNTINTLAENFR